MLFFIICSDSPMIKIIYRANLDPPKRIDINGQHRHLFYRRPVMPFLKPAVPTMRFHMNLEYDNMEKAMKDAAVRCCHLPDRTQTKQTQTDYRESEAQTSPWTPPYKVRPDENPEVLTIAHLSWGHGLPAGMHEVEIINRMRMKRAWEAILPPMDNATNIKTRTTIIEAMEIDDWAFREAEIQFMMDTRMELMEKYAKLKDAAREKSIGDRYQRVEDLIDKRRDMEIRNIRQKLGRELRKLTVKYHGGQNKWAKKCSAARGLGDSIFKLKKSAKNYHEIINRRILDDKNVPDADENDKYVLLPTYSELKAVKPKQKAHELCVRETRWNEEKLRKLHAELKSIRMDIKPDKNTSFMKRRYKLPPMPITPKLPNERNVNESQERAAVLIQTLVTGRAIQCVMFEGRDRCRELIEELQSTHWLQSDTKKLRQMEKRHVIELQQSENHRTLQEDRLNEILNMLEGMTLSGMLDYLSKELVRLKDERKAHAFALLAERERTKREAEEAGRRQLEEQRRRECDEMFRQMVKVNQDTVELYLEDIIKEGIEWVSDAEAKQYILETADKVDKTLQYANEHAQGLAEQEMVSDMIYNFVLPDVDKQIVRKRMLERQASYLKNAHAAIYNKILELPPIERKTPSTEPTAAGESDKTAEVEEERLTEPDQLVEELTEETSADWIKRRIIGEIISPEETLTGSILKHLISRSVLSDGEKIARYILENVIKDVEALVDNSQMSILSKLYKENLHLFYAIVLNPSIFSFSTILSLRIIWVLLF
ncbi:cilia- and flagella-associated protein 91-like isoform X1 [Neodiprion virginianus]|uniref:cilia- and flagella-associated protein 91-like isoform X1 n=1 Tax=Neodiprion virginianus TaxID=2961670 RepID=UPI001EE75021|nr:cilia- and flagella-associated protein 91-like isoform X1 [Neodiprion virginianus]XP_046612989.1 cilia- and flagella-associated protein 91-like isoform X1 [Neodiprion virginianus]